MKSIKLINVKAMDEILELARLAEEIWREYYISIITIEQIDYMINQFQSVPAIELQIQQGYEYYLIRYLNRSVGYLSVKVEPSRKLFLSKFYIGKEYRGRGYASLTMAFLKRLCAERELSHIWLTVNRHNEPSIKIYEKMGFKIEREQVADIGNGFVMDDFIMEWHHR